METRHGLIRQRYVLFMISVVLTIVATQAIIQYDLNQQNSDAELINIAGRQRMLSQRISKLTLFIYYNSRQNKGSKFYTLDSLNKLINNWERVHFYLIDKNQKEQKSQAIDSLLTLNTRNLKQIVESCRKILKSPDTVTIKNSIDKIAEVELPFLLRMERAVVTYQREAEEKLQLLKRLELGLSIAAITILVCEFIFIMLPVLFQLQKSNRKLAETNSELSTSNEEIQSNLEQIRLLQSDLEIKQRQYQGLVDEATDMIHELNEEGKFSFINPVLETTTGFPKEELLGKFYWELIFAEDVKNVVDFYNEQRKNLQEVSYLEFRIQSKQGTIIWIGQNVKMFFDDKWIYKVNVVARDISGIKESQKTLSLERILLRTIIDNVPINIYAKNTHSQKILANKAEYEYVGAKTEEEVIGKSDLEIYPDESAFVSIDEDRRVLNGELMINVETANTRKDGSQTWFLISKVPLRNEKGEIVGLVGISMNITDQKNAQDELARKEKLYRLVSENSQDVISLHKLDGSFTYISPACIDLHGYTPEEMIGRNGIEFILEDDAQLILNNAHSVKEKMMRNETIEPTQFRIATKNRGLVWVENAIKPVFENGILTGFQSTVRDISIRKAYEAALREAKEKAESATQAKSQFLSMMSHEIRTPMNGIIGLTNILMSEEPRPDQIEKMNLLKFSCDNLLTIINDILDFSKAESGKMQLENISFNLSDILHHYRKLFSNRATEKDIELRFNLDKDLPAFVFGDPVRLGQIINNLIGNAIKFTQNGFVEVNVQWLERVEDVHTIRFTIKDSGIGIPDDKINTVFEGFNQAATDTTRKFGGTGLGLSITKKLLDLMDSRINVKSKLGTGSEFSFDLRMKESEPLLLKKEGQEISTRLQGLRLLLVEDNKVNQVVAKNFLMKWGFEITVAEDGEQAIEKLESMKYDLVLMDIHMPIMNGYEAVKTIRAKDNPYFKNLSIIALTADVSPEIEKKARDAGMTDIMSKPFQPRELQAILEKYSLGSQSGERAKNLSFPNLQIYTEGNAEFEAELKRLIIQNLDELKDVVGHIRSNNETGGFASILHKCRTTLRIVDYEPLNKNLEKLKNAIEAYLTQEVPISKMLASDLITIIGDVQFALKR